MAKLRWTSRANFGPVARTSHTMAFDSVRNRVVLFGGVAQAPSLALTPLGDTWEWDGLFWTQVEDTGPSARTGASMVYDSVRKVSLLFGGTDAQAPLGDTWEWDGEGWTKVAETGPSPRSITGMAFDSKRGRTVLFGGQSADSFGLNDTWEFDGEDWTQVQDAGPAARSAHAMAFDTASHRTILFGGAGADDRRFGDTWAWDGGEWVQIADFGPSPRSNAAMVSAGGNDLILFGGLKTPVADQPLESFGDTWEFDGKLWTQRQDIGPGPLLNTAMAYDSGRGRVVLFGGTGAEKPNLVSGLTWEAAVSPTLVSPAVLKVQSISVPDEVPAGQLFPATFTLNGPAAPGGLLVHVQGRVFDENDQPLLRFTVAAGLSTMVVQLKFAVAGLFVLLAGIQEPGNEVSINVKVI